MPLISLCQNDFGSEQYKYWYYRERLKWFVMPGTEHGQSVLFSIRNPSSNHWDGTTQTIQTVPAARRW